MTAQHSHPAAAGGSLGRARIIQPVWLRITHWLNALAAI